MGDGVMLTHESASVSPSCRCRLTDYLLNGLNFGRRSIVLHVTGGRYIMVMAFGTRTELGSS